MWADGQSLHVCCTDCGASLWHGWNKSGIFLNSAASIHKTLNIIQSGDLDSVKVQVKKRANSYRAVGAGVKHLLIESRHPCHSLTPPSQWQSRSCSSQDAPLAPSYKKEFGLRIVTLAALHDWVDYPRTPPFPVCHAWPLPNPLYRSFQVPFSPSVPGEGSPGHTELLFPFPGWARLWWDKLCCSSGNEFDSGVANNMIYCKWEWIRAPKSWWTGVRVMH